MNFSGIIGVTLDGKYAVERRLGTGGMGSVFLANHIGTGRHVAIKIIAPEFMRRAEFVERFRREARAAGRLRHPNVVDVTDFGISVSENGSEIAYLVMELLDGCTLGEVLAEEKSLSVEFTIDIIEQVCSAVDAAHRHGIIHRDLKPDNIWLEPNQRGGYTVKVLDFGIAKFDESGEKDESVQISQLREAPETTIEEVGNETVESTSDTQLMKTRNSTLIVASNTQIGDFESKSNVQDTSTPNQDEASTRILEPNTIIQEATVHLDKKPDLVTHTDLSKPISNELTRVGAVLGTPLYMSPEQCRGQKLTPRTDIYSLGVITYQMLSGKTPFEGSFEEVMDAHMNRVPPPLNAPGVSRRCKSVVMEALSKDPEKRGETATGYATRLRSSSEGAVRLFREAVIIYSERLPEFLLISLIVFVPVFLTMFLRVGFSFLTVFEVIDTQPYTRVITASLGFVFFIVQTIANSILMATITWVVAQTVAFPLRPVSVKSAFQQVRAHLKPLILTSIISTVVILAGFLLCVLPGIYFMTRFLLSSTVVMLEDLKSKAALARSGKLIHRSFLTAFGILIFIIFVPGVVSGLIGGGISSFIRAVQLQRQVAQMKEEGVKPQSEPEPEVNDDAGNFSISVGKRDVIITNDDKQDKADVSKSNMNKIFAAIKDGIFDLVWTPLNLLFSSFGGILVSLLYFKTRMAGGDSNEDLLETLAKADSSKSLWQTLIKRKTSYTNLNEKEASENE
ncbi:MAG: serine/threonine-protein kinase [Pyrinomonadaceae bacterium]